MMNTKIYIVTHKNFEVPKNPIYQPILAGSFEYDKSKFPDFLYDDTGDNISNKHDLYSEFTVLYWMWKNSDADIIGENHYRRYFLKCKDYKDYRAILNEDDLTKIYDRIMDEQYIENIFSQGYNCILPKKCYHPGFTMYDIYYNAREDTVLIFDSIRKVMSKYYPEYVSDLDEMLKLRRSYFKCINIMKREQFDAFCTWIFGVYSGLEKIDFKFKDREFAFMGEWLMNVWILHNVKTGFLKPKDQYFINTDKKARFVFSEVTNTDACENLYSITHNQLYISARRSMKRFAIKYLGYNKKESK